MTINLSTLRPKRGSVKSKKRVGRGNGSGLGTYAGRGMNGQGARKGKKFRAMFEGGQTSFIQKLPKLKGFKNPSHIEYTAINLSDLEDNFTEKEEVNPKTLEEKGLIRTITTPYKILGSGELKKKLKIIANQISKPAQEKLDTLKADVTIVKYTKKTGKDLKELKK